MNHSMVRYITARLLQIEALLMIFPLAVSFIYGESWTYKMSFISVMLGLVVIGQLLAWKKPTNQRMNAREGLVIVALTWIFYSFFGGLPFVINGDIPAVVDAFFEMSSGFTTTGSSILKNVELLSHSSLFWRSFTHLVGGMGILVFALAILPQIDAQSVHIMKAEVPGPTFGKLVSKLSTTARILYVIYLVMTAVVMVLLWVSGMSLFDSMLHAFGVAGTGGFGIKNGSVAPYQNPVAEWIMSVGMIVFAINFNLFYMILIGRAKQALKSEELKGFLLIVLGAVVLICLNLWPSYDSFSTLIRDVFFTVSSVISTSGFSTADFGQWPGFSQTVLLIIMFVGGCAGSTAGGLKVSRIIHYVKIAINEVRQVVQPNRVLTIHYDNKPITKEGKQGVTSYFVVYMCLFFFLLLMVSLDAPDFLSGFSAVATTLNNVGPALGQFGPAYSFAPLNDFTKILLSFSMLAGRLELFPILILFAPRTWRR